MAMTTHAPEIGYILKGFPRTSETFITNEIFLLENSGVKITVFSLKRLQGQLPHGVVSRIKAPVIYLPETTPSAQSNLLTWLWHNLPHFSASHRQLFLRRPWAYLRTLLNALIMCVKYRTGTFDRPNRVFIKEFLQAGFIALKVLESGRIRHLHAHFCHTSTTVTMLASILCDTAFSFTAHAKDIYREDMNPGDLLAVKMKSASFAVTCTKANQKYLDRLRTARTPLYIIYHGIDLTLFAPADEDPGIEDSTQLPLILSAGRFVEKKGFTYLVEACRLLKDKGYQFQCWIVGGGDQYLETVRNLITQLNLADTVKLHPALTQEELKRLYQRATVFALPCQVIETGDRDGIPNVLVEAMAMELPVVSTEISGIPELIDHGANGLLVPQKNAVALAAAIGELLKDRVFRHELGESAREKVCRDFDARRNVLKLKTLFDLKR